MNDACIITGIAQPENEHDFWLERAKIFRKQFGNDVDVVVSVDGKISGGGLDGIILINHDEVLGALPRYRLYAGWLRNIIDGLEYSMKYPYCAWLETDIIVQNKEKFSEKLHQDDYFGCGIVKPYGFLDPAFMILNSMEKRQELSNLLKKYETGLMENYLEPFLKGYADFEGFKREHFEQNLGEYDYVSQIFDCNDYQKFLEQNT